MVEVVTEEENDLGNLITIILTFCVAILGYIYAYLYASRRRRDANNTNLLDALPVIELPPLPKIKLTYEQLKQFDGTRIDGRILIAFKGKIYDVSSNVEQFGLHGTLNRVAGRDFTKYLKIIMCVSESEVNILDEWEHILNMNYQCVGVLINKQGEIIYEVEDNDDDDDHDDDVGNINDEVDEDEEPLSDELRSSGSGSKNVLNQISSTESHKMMKKSSANSFNQALRM